MMTIDEFMRDIAPKMRKGWVAMEENGIWNWFNNEPTAFKNEWIYGLEIDNYHTNLTDIFDIAHVDDWTQSLRKVGE